MSDRTVSLQQALNAQRALRTAAGMGEEQFPLQAFVGMISDEVQALRERGHTDEQIAEIIRSNSSIEITPAEIAENYAPEEARHPHGE